MGVATCRLEALRRTRPASSTLTTRRNRPEIEACLKLGPIAVIVTRWARRMHELRS